MLVFGRDIDEVLERVRAAIHYHTGHAALPIRLAVSRYPRGELRWDLNGLNHRQDDLYTRELVRDRPGLA